MWNDFCDHYPWWFLWPLSLMILHNTQRSLFLRTPLSYWQLFFDAQIPLMCSFSYLQNISCGIHIFKLLLDRTFIRNITSEMSDCQKWKLKNFVKTERFRENVQQKYRFCDWINECRKVLLLLKGIRWSEYINDIVSVHIQNVDVIWFSECHLQNR